MTQSAEPSLIETDMLSLARIFLPESPAETQAQWASTAERLRQEFSSMPWHAQRAAADPLYWLKFCSGRPNW